MRSILYASAALPFLAASALANPQQYNYGSQPAAQSQVWGNGSSANANQAFGGTARAYGGSSRSSATGGAGGRASANQTVNVNGGGYGGYGGGNNFQAPAPDVMLPNIAGGMDVCLGGIGFGGAGRPGGGLFSYSWEMHDCRMRETGQMLWNAGFRMEAVRVWCKIPEVRQAFRGTPQQCPADGPAPVEHVSTAPPSPRNYRYDYCYTASAGELKQHRECFARPK